MACSYQSIGAGVDEEVDDTLSFCDIPLYTDASADSSTSSYSEQAAGSLFEFFSCGSPAAAYQPAENFVFCGRLIPYADSPSPSPSAKKKQRVIKNGSALSSSSSIRWYKVMFGSMRLPGEMDMADIKSRQRRRHPTPKAPKAAMVGIKYEEVVDHRRRQRKSSSANGLIGLVRSLSCRGSCSTAILN